MKNKINATLTLALALLAVAAVSQDKPQTRTHSVIVLQARNYYWQDGSYVAPTVDWGGFSVFNVDASMNLRTNEPVAWYLFTPTLANAYDVNTDPTNSIAERTAAILDAGYRIAGQSGDGYNVTLTFTK